MRVLSFRDTPPTHPLLRQTPPKACGTPINTQIPVSSWRKQPNPVTIMIPHTPPRVQPTPTPDLVKHPFGWKKCLFPSYVPPWLHNHLPPTEHWLPNLQNAHLRVPLQVHQTASNKPTSISPTKPLCRSQQVADLAILTTTRANNLNLAQLHRRPSLPASTPTATHCP